MVEEIRGVMRSGENPMFGILEIANVISQYWFDEPYKSYDTSRHKPYGRVAYWLRKMEKQGIVCAFRTQRNGTVYLLKERVK